MMLAGIHDCSPRWVQIHNQSSSLLPSSQGPDKFISKTGFTTADSGDVSHTFLRWNLRIVYLKARESFSLTVLAAAAAKSLQSCPTLCDPIDSSPSGSSVPGILRARTLEWGAISFSNAWKWKVKVKSLSRVRLFVTPWTTAHQALLSMRFSRRRVLQWVAIAFLLSL